jgi:predicted RNase H-like nuclease
VQVLGVDAAGRWGWIGVVADADGFVAAEVAATVLELIERVEQRNEEQPLAVIGVDIPIGLADAPVRRVDPLMREHVGPRRASVFAAPHPSIIDLDDHAEAVAVLRAQGLPGISRQGFNLIPRIREVAGLASDPRVVEVFPESSFRALAGAPVGATKKSWGGMTERRRLLADADPPLRIPDDLGPAGRVPVDDVLDATAAAWTSWRVAKGSAERFGDPAQSDAATGRPIAVWV